MASLLLKNGKYHVQYHHPEDAPKRYRRVSTKTASKPQAKKVLTHYQSIESEVIKPPEKGRA
jgi:hypothetical protein